MPWILAVVALAAALACAPRPRTVTESSAATTKALFVPYAVAEIVGVKDPHDFRGKPLCQRCHFEDGKLTAEPIALCAECHSFSHGNHPVEVVQKTPAKDLPLLSGGRVACHTCHDPHQKKRVLRKPFTELCTSCHRRH